MTLHYEYTKLIYGQRKRARYAGENIVVHVRVQIVNERVGYNKLGVTSRR